MRCAVAVAGLLVVVGVGCHRELPNGDDDAIDAPSGIDSSNGGDGSAGPGWTMLIQRSWSLASDHEGYECTRIQVPSDLWVSGFRALSPIGTHHSVLTISSTSSPLGDYDCSPGTLDQEMMFASGINTDDMILPDGVAIHLTAGMYLNLNLHLFNESDDPYTNQTSGVLVKTVDPALVVNEADMAFSGTLDISIPHDGATHTAVGGCTLSKHDWHVFTLWPHMHQAATHQSLIVTHAGQPTTMLDTAFQFSEQKNYPMADTLVHIGDTITTTCSYINNTTAPVIDPLTFGDSSNAEMCFTGIYKYPVYPDDTLYDCVN